MTRLLPLILLASVGGCTDTSTVDPDVSIVWQVDRSFAAGEAVSFSAAPKGFKDATAVTWAIEPDDDVVMVGIDSMTTTLTFPAEGVYVLTVTVAEPTSGKRATSEVEINISNNILVAPQ